MDYTFVVHSADYLENTKEDWFCHWHGEASLFDDILKWAALKILEDDEFCHLSFEVDLIEVEHLNNSLDILELLKSNDLHRKELMSLLLADCAQDLDVNCLALAINGLEYPRCALLSNLDEIAVLSGELMDSYCVGCFFSLNHIGVLITCRGGYVLL